MVYILFARVYNPAMNPKEALGTVAGYLIASDVMNRYSQAENRVKLERTGSADVLPVEDGLK